MQTYWNGEPTKCRQVEVVVGPAARPTWWFADLVGTRRKAVEVNYCGDTFYLDDEGGEGWRKVTAGRGSPQFGHSELAASEVHDR